MTSRPLLTIVAESIVIFAPIDQFGCCKACSTVTPSNSSRVRSRKEPPDAVIVIFAICERSHHLSIEK